MTGLIAIDESGDLGSDGSRYFLMASIVARRARSLLKAYKVAPTSNGPEIKFYNAEPKERINVLKEVAKAESLSIVFVRIDKKNPSDYVERGNKLYHKTLKNLMEDSMEVCFTKDLKIYVDESRFIESNHLKQMAEDASKRTGKNVKDCKKVSSDRCVRIADYVVGAIRMKYENEDSSLFEIIEEKISIAREPLGPR